MRKYILVKLLVVFFCGSAFAQYPGNVSGNLSLWMRADQGTSTTIENKPVTSWVDLSDNAFTATDSSMGGPLFKGSHINSHPALYFDGVDDGLNFGSNYIFAGTGGVTIFAVIQPDAAAAQKDRQFIYDFGDYPTEGYGAVYGHNNSGIYCPTTYGGVDGSQSLSHSRSTQPTLYTGVVNFSNSVELYIDGLNQISETISLTALSSTEIREYPQPSASSEGPVTIGRQSMENSISADSGRLFQGHIAELIVYNNILSASDKNKVQSYLAMRYGISLDQSTAQDVLSSTGKKIWNNSSNGIYLHNITTIGRDDNSNFDQAISTTVNSDRMMTMWHGTLSEYSAPEQLENMEFITWSHNNAVLDSINTIDVPYGILERIGRTWRLSCKNGSTEEAIVWNHASITIDLDKLTGDAALPPGITDMQLSWLRLLVSDSTSMRNSEVILPDSVDASTKRIHFFIDGLLTDGHYITIASWRESPLPVELLNFTATIQSDEVKLLWQTASENNNEKFVVQRSADMENWETINQLKGAGNSTTLKHYGTIDRNPIKGEAYYRLKQVDFNGENSFSDFVLVNFRSEKPEYLEVLVYPNPIVNSASIVSQGSAGDTDIQILDKKGLVRFRDRIGVKQNYKLDSSSLENGVYILRANSGKMVYYQKIIVNNN